MKKKFIDVGGIRTCYREGGDGKVLLVLHGWGIDGSRYEELCSLLSKHFHVYALDFPGFGGTEEPKETWGVDEYKKFVLRFLDNVSVDHFFVLAHSFGSRIAIKLGAEDRERISKMVLTGAAGIRPKKGLKRKVFGALAFLGKKTFSLPGLSLLFEPAKRVLYRLAREQDYLKASGIMKSVFTKVVGEDLTPYLKDVRPKVLLLWGKEDKLTPLRDGELMQAKMPFATLRVFEGVGHRLPYERATIVADEIVRFLES